MLEKDFLFGVASSAYQIEGAWNEDGKCPSIWDEISHGNWIHNVLNKHTGDVACDHYHQYENDVEIMKILGVDAYRFSISWSRICTQKCVCSNMKGIQFYRNLVKKLKEANIEPFATLYHWDLPKWLDDIGGWANPKSIDYFKCYAETMFEALPDVKNWITFNEPAVFVNNYWGHNNMSKAIKNVLLAHGEVVKLFKKKVYANPTTHKNPNGKIGISLNLMPIMPHNPLHTKDKHVAENIDKKHNGLWLEPIYKGKFPDGINKILGFDKYPLKLTKKEKSIMSTPIDFLGINYYTGVTVKYNPKKLGNCEVVSSKHSKDEIGVDIKPYGLYNLVMEIKEKYNNPEMYITENGRACVDVFGHDKKIHDKERIEYMKQHLFWADKAVEGGANLKGYFYWSIMDNFEWLFGYNKRFGLIYIFYPTQSRVCKDSYFWYQSFIESKEFREKTMKAADMDLFS